MTDKEILRTRIVLAHSINRSPDSIYTTKSKDPMSGDVITIFCVDDFKEMNLAFSFEKIPSIEEAREGIKDGYLTGCEIGFEIEFGEIDKKFR